MGGCEEVGIGSCEARDEYGEEIEGWDACVPGGL